MFVKKFLVLSFLFVCFFNFNLFSQYSFFIGQSKINMNEFNDDLSSYGFSQMKEGLLCGMNIDTMKLNIKNISFATKIYLLNTEETEYSIQYESGFVTTNIKPKPYYNELSVKYKGRLIPILFGLNYNNEIIKRIYFNAGIFAGIGFMRMKGEITVKKWERIDRWNYDTGSVLLRNNTYSRNNVFSKSLGIVECSVGFDYKIYENTLIGIEYGYRYATTPSMDGTNLDFSGTNLLFNIKYNI